MCAGARLAYDGRGNAVVQSREELEGAVEQLGGYGQGLYAERWAPFVKVTSAAALSILVLTSKIAATSISMLPAKRLQAQLKA